MLVLDLLFDFIFGPRRLFPSSGPLFLHCRWHLWEICQHWWIDLIDRYIDRYIFTTKQQEYPETWEGVLGAGAQFQIEDITRLFCNTKIITYTFLLFDVLGCFGNIFYLTFTCCSAVLWIWPSEKAKKLGFFYLLYWDSGHLGLCTRSSDVGV